MNHPPSDNRELREPAAKTIRERIEQSDETLWRLEDFSDLPSAAVAQTLSRLARDNQIQRLSKGTYYRARPSAFGPSRPSPNALRKLASRRRHLFPAGTAAANLLGFTTQTPRRGEVSTPAMSIPRKLVGPDVMVHTRRPQSWERLAETEAALLDFLRRGGRTSELSPDDTIERTEHLLRQQSFYERLLNVAQSEPPRVRAILGAIGEKIGLDQNKLEKLRSSLNPLSKFDFGLFAALPNAKAWQAKAAPT